MSRRNRGDAHSVSDVPGDLCEKCNKSGDSQWIQRDICDLWYHYNCSGIPVDLPPQIVRVKLLLFKCKNCLQKKSIVVSSSTMQQVIKDALSDRYVKYYSPEVSPFNDFVVVSRCDRLNGVHGGVLFACRKDYSFNLLYSQIFSYFSCSIFIKVNYTFFGLMVVYNPPLSSDYRVESSKLKNADQNHRD